MNNNSTNQTFINNPSSLFITTTTSQHIPMSSIQQKRYQFENKIRQQHRDKIKKNKRQQQLQFLKSIGLATYQQQHSHNYQNQRAQKLFQQIQQESENMYVEFMTNCQSGHSDQSKNDKYDFSSEYMSRAYQEINQYKEKDFNRDPTQLWNTIQKEMIQYLKQSKQLCSSEMEWIQQTLQVVNHILSMEMYYSVFQWSKFRCIQPQQYGLILEYVWKVYSQHLREKREILPQTKQSISTLVLILICNELKLEGTKIDFRLSPQTQKRQKIQLWSNRILFQQILEIPWLWGHWTLINYTNIMDVNLYSIETIFNLILKQTISLEKEIIEHKQQQNKINSNNLNKGIKYICLLIGICQQIMDSSLIKIQKYYSIELFKSINKSYQEFLAILQTIVMNVYQTIGNVNSLLNQLTTNINPNYKPKENKIQQNIFFINVNRNNNEKKSLLLMKLIKLLQTTDRAFFFIRNKNFNTNNNTQQQFQNSKYVSNQLKHFNKQLERHYIQVIKQNQLPRNHFIYKQSKLFNCRSINSGLMGQGKKNNGEFYEGVGLEEFEREFVTIKVITLSQILTLCSRNMFKTISIHNNNNTSSNTTQQQPTNLSSLQLKCLNLTLYNILHMFQPSYFINKILQLIQQINSIQQLILLIKGIKQGENSITVYLVLLCKQLFNVFVHMVSIVNNNGQQKKLRQNGDRENEGLEFNSLILAMKALNTFAQVQQHNIWRQSCLLYQTITRTQSSQPKQFISLIQQTHNFLDYLYNRFTKGNKNLQLVDIKMQIGLFVQTIVYNYFPLQTHFDQFAIGKSNDDNVRQVMALLMCYDDLTMGQNDNNKQNEYYRTKFEQRLKQMFTQHSLDHQTQQLLTISQNLLQQTSIQTQIKAIKIVYLLLLLSDNQSAFNYFQSFIKSSTQLYKKIEHMAQQSQHSKVRQTAEECIELIDAGFEEDGGSDGGDGNR